MFIKDHDESTTVVFLISSATSVDGGDGGEALHMFAFVNRVMRSCQSFPKTTSTGNMLKIHKSYSFKHIDAFRKHSFLFGE